MAESLLVGRHFVSSICKLNPKENYENLFCVKRPRFLPARRAQDHWTRRWVCFRTVYRKDVGSRILISFTSLMNAHADILSSFQSTDWCTERTHRRYRRPASGGGARQKHSRFDVIFDTHHRVFFRPGVRRAFTSCISVSLHHITPLDIDVSSLVVGSRLTAVTLSIDYQYAME